MRVNSHARTARTHTPSRPIIPASDVAVADVADSSGATTATIAANDERSGVSDDPDEEQPTVMSLLRSLILTFDLVELLPLLGGNRVERRDVR